MASGNGLSSKSSDQALEVDSAIPSVPAPKSDKAAAAADSLTAVLAQQGLTLEQVLPHDAGGWVRILSALDNEDR